jgi:hypothetical protein
MREEGEKRGKEHFEMTLVRKEAGNQYQMCR